MSGHRRFLRQAVLGGAAAGGLLLGHLLDYAVVIRHPIERHELLEQTGHGYLPSAVPLVIGLAIAACLATVGLGITRGTRRSRGLPAGWAAMWAAGVQAAGFVVLEVSERAFSGAAFSGSFAELLSVGLLLQFAVGALVGFVLAMLYRAGEQLGIMLGRYRGPRRASAAVRPLTPEIRARSLWLRSARPIRAPPRSFVS